MSILVRPVRRSRAYILATILALTACPGCNLPPAIASKLAIAIESKLPQAAPAIASKLAIASESKLPQAALAIASKLVIASERAPAKKIAVLDGAAPWREQPAAPGTTRQSNSTPERYARALADYNQAIRYAKGEYDRARADYNQAIADHNQAIRYAKGEYDRARADYNQVIADYNQAIWDAEGEYDRALADYNQAIADYNQAIRYANEEYYRAIASNKSLSCGSTPLSEEPRQPQPH